MYRICKVSGEENGSSYFGSKVIRICIFRENGEKHGRLLFRL